MNCMKKTFTANLIQICTKSEAGTTMYPIIDTYSYPAPVSNQDLVAILHVIGTHSFHAIPLNSCSTYDELKTIVKRDLGAELTYPSHQILENYYIERNHTDTRARTHLASHEAQSLVSSH